MGRGLRKIDWEAVAGIIAAVVALVLHLVDVADVEVLLSIVLVVLALILLRDLRREGREEALATFVTNTETTLQEARRALSMPDAVLVGPSALRATTEQFAATARGDMVWFNVCLSMFAPPALFDVLLVPALESPRITSIQFVLPERERQRWKEHVRPKLDAHADAAKVREPVWCDLDETVSCILAEQGVSGRFEALLSFWGEPFMARASGQDVPRYIFHVQAQSELIPRLRELEQSYRLRGI